LAAAARDGCLARRGRRGGLLLRDRCGGRPFAVAWRLARGHRLEAGESRVEAGAPLRVNRRRIAAIQLVEVGHVPGVDEVQIARQLSRVLGGVRRVGGVVCSHLLSMLGGTRGPGQDFLNYTRSREYSVSM